MHRINLIGITVGVLMLTTACGDDGEALVEVSAASETTVSTTSPTLKASTWCTGLPNQNLSQAKASFESRCGEKWNDQVGHVCDYKPDGFHCNGVTTAGNYPDAPDVPAAALAAPTQLALKLRPDRIVLSWRGSAGADGYNIYRNNRYVGTKRNGRTYVDRVTRGANTYSVVAFRGTEFSTHSAKVRVARDISVRQAGRLPTFSEPGAVDVAEVTLANGEVATLTQSIGENGRVTYSHVESESVTMTSSYYSDGSSHHYFSENGVIRDDYQVDSAGRPVAGGIKNGEPIDAGRLPIDDYLDAMEELLAIEEAIKREQQQEQQETTGGDGDPDQYGGITDNSNFGGSTGGLAGSRNGGAGAHPAPELRRVWFTQANGRHYLTIAWGDWDAASTVSGSEVQVSTDGGRTWFSEMIISSPAANSKKLGNTGANNQRISTNRTYKVRVRWTLVGGGMSGWSVVRGT